MTSSKKFNAALNARISERSILPTWQWCEKFLNFNESGNNGPFTTTGAEYTREVLTDFGDSSVTDEVLVWGSQSRKTGCLMGGMAWSIVNDPCGVLWVMPSLGLAKKFSKQRWMKLLKASPVIKELIPRGGSARHDFATFEQMIGNATFNFVGSNSPANVKSNPCKRVIQDEVEEFFEGDDSNVDASTGADERTKGQPNAQRWKTSTPKLISGKIWQCFLKGDQRRYFLSCPHCSQEIVLAWSKRFTIFKITGKEAFVKWDSEAKRSDGTWDLERVEKTAHYECPHCKGNIVSVAPLLPNGKWIATNPDAQKGYVSRHLPSLYSTMPECRVGKLAVKFLQMKRSINGLRGFITGDLAEPDIGQEISVERVEIIKRLKDDQSELVKSMVIDCQQKAPYFWGVIRGWKPGACHGLKFFHADTYEELRQIQLENGVMDKLVWLDSGFQARSGEADVYRNCAEYGEMVQTSTGLVHIGWTPTKGFPGRKRWKDKETGEMVPYHFAPLDPYLGTADAGQVQMSLFEFSAEYYKDVLENLRKRIGGFAEKFVWSVDDNMCADMTEYWKHMDGQVKKTKVDKNTGFEKIEWCRRGKYWPDHGFACEYGQLALAAFNGWLTIE